MSVFETKGRYDEILDRKSLHLNKHTLLPVLRPNSEKIRVLNRNVRNLEESTVRRGTI